MKTLIVALMLAFTAFAEPKACYRIKPFCEGCRPSEPAWSVEYKASYTGWKPLLNWLSTVESLQNTLIVFSIADGRKKVAEIEAIGGPEKWNERQQILAKASAKVAEAQKRREAAEAGKKLKQETVEICPL